MKKKLLFTFACVMALMAGFVSCTNDDFEEFAPVAEMQKSAMTRSAGNEITMEDVKARMAELNEMYDANFCVNESAPASSYDDFFFNIVENVMRENVGLDPIDYVENSVETFSLLIDDASFDNINVASTSSTPEVPGASGDEYIHETNKTYPGSAVVYESMEANDFTDFDSEFNRYLWSFSYSFTYGRQSSLSFDSFNNQTNYNVDNMPNDMDHQSLLQSDVEIIAQEYQMEYVPNSLELKSNISYNWNEPKELRDVEFGYYYRIRIGDYTFEVVARNNDRATAVNQIQ